MARSIDTIFQEIQIEKNTMSTLVSKLTNENGTITINTEQDLLTLLESTTSVAIWKLWAYITAVQINFEEQIWDDIEVNLRNIKESAPVYNSKWWVDRALEWQDGYTVSINPDNNSIYYSTIDELAREIGSANVTDSLGKVILKIRGKSTNLLTPSQLASFQSYIQAIKPIGDRVIINNYNPDDIKLYYTIYYNPLISIATITSNVESAINTYLENLGFDSEVNITDLTNILQDIEGVVDPVFVSAQAKHGSNPYVSFTNYYTAVAGYCIIDTSTPLSTSITYITKTN